MRKPNLAINPTHKGADAFWKFWRENGETGHHGYYESTWGAINAALKESGLWDGTERHVFSRSGDKLHCWKCGEQENHKNHTAD